MASNGQEMPRWRCVADAKAGAAEVPIWAAGVLYWVDVPRGRLNATTVDLGETRTWEFDEPLGCYALRSDGRGAILALDSGIYTFDFETERKEFLYPAPYDRTKYTFNDGRCDPAGRFWPGSKRLPTSSEPNGGASFWRVEAGGITQMIDGITIANGIAFNPSGDTLYLADAANSQILAFDFNREEGTATNRRQFTSLPDGSRPDGAAVDTEGGYWSALFHAGRIVRFRPDGTVDRDLRAPTSDTTMVCFGGDDYRTIFATTARDFCSEEDLRREPLAGGIFACEMGAQGFPEPCCSF